MEIEQFWKDITPFCKCEKGAYNIINYGYRSKHRSPCKTKCEKRKAYRQIRKYGFDFSELWSLDLTIMRLMSDTYGGFWRMIGNHDNWNDYDLDCNYVDFWQNSNNPEYFEKMTLWSRTRHDSFKLHLRDFLNNMSPGEFQEYAAFVSPRLRKLADIIHGWPADDKFPTFEEWQTEIRNMATHFDNGTYSESYIEYYFSSWD